MAFIEHVEPKFSKMAETMYEKCESIGWLNLTFNKDFLSARWTCHRPFGTRVI
jgi:hypothetical protein